MGSECSSAQPDLSEGEVVRTSNHGSITKNSYQERLNKYHVKQIHTKLPKCIRQQGLNSVKDYLDYLSKQIDLDSKILSILNQDISNPQMTLPKFHFYADLVQRSSEFKNHLIKIVKESSYSNKTEVIIKASNAISILNTAKVSFSDMDLKGIQVPNSYLKEAFFCNSELEDANLSGSNIVDANFHSTNLTGAKLTACVTMEGQIESFGLDNWPFKNIQKAGQYLLIHGKNQTAEVIDTKSKNFDKILYKLQIDDTKLIQDKKKGHFLLALFQESRNRVEFFDIQSKKITKMLHFGSDELKGLNMFALSDDGRLLVYAKILQSSKDYSQTYQMTVYNVQKMRPVKRFLFQDRSINTMRFLPNNKDLLINGSDNLMIMDVGIDKARFSYTQQDHTKENIVISENQKLLVFLDKHGYLRKLDMSKSHQEKSKGLQSPKLYSQIALYRVIENIKGEKIQTVIATSGQQIDLIDADNDICLAQIHSLFNIVRIFVSPQDFNQLFIFTDRLSIQSRVSRLSKIQATKEYIAIVQQQDLLKEYLRTSRRTSIPKIKSFDVTPDGLYIALPIQNQQISLIKTSTSEEVLQLSDHTENNTTIKFSDDGRNLATGGDSCTVAIYFLQGEYQKYYLKGHQKPITCLAWSPDGAILASGSEDTTVCLWDMNGPGFIEALRGHQDAITDVSFASRGMKFVTVSWDMSIRIWNTRGWSCVKSISGLSNPVLGMVRSGVDQGLFMAYDTKNKLFSFDVNYGAIKGDLSLVFDEKIKCMDCSNDGKLIVFGSKDCSVTIWSTYKNNIQQVLRNHISEISYVRFCPDSRGIVTADESGIMKFYFMNEIDGEQRWILGWSTFRDFGLDFSESLRTRASIDVELDRFIDDDDLSMY